ncbi:hypothetical protein BYT27DRAFT_7183286 [Phlegmacium glaucopus]|nr:hypothetical protein BYT27DRAFT_7183286 [Phlegmacium glaucopus]
MKGLSIGQKVKIILGAGRRPHVMCLDDLVFLIGYLDCESLTTLIKASQGFRRWYSSSPMSAKVPSTRSNDVIDDEPESVLLFSFSVPRIAKVTLVYPPHTSRLPYRSSPESLSKAAIRPFAVH